MESYDDSSSSVPMTISRSITGNIETQKASLGLGISTTLKSGIELWDYSRLFAASHLVHPRSTIPSVSTMNETSVAVHEYFYIEA